MRSRSVHLMVEQSKTSTDDDCTCNGIFCDGCEGTASFTTCVDPCVP